MPPDVTDAELKQAILILLHTRGPGKSICPSEVARSAAASNDPAKWRPLMQPIREAAAELAQQGAIVATQRGRIVDSATARGPIRLRRC